ncbi:Non-specific serine/threonine protein kinase [Gracilibacillus halophilus YIM-C55.5]|uniref:Non-specific serine/threonine protein kinase n=1 Tax=Gracilibacillus halophilus YIM-C55.5 TaxID=1308866 RepID=N4WUP8_9BACI|nr:formylglycine-generating enzyme family protein [Gracilibacillus halophilus]ENH96841.1 Non-specific serine/threonine protein kinase [Gracilibacillus halophilus YIM-C55.5]
MEEHNLSCCHVSRADFLSSSKKEENFIIQSESSSIKDMVLLNGGKYMMGTNDDEGIKADGESPIQEVTVSPFYIDIHTVTNQEFQNFVEDTGYKTEAEQYGWSFVFYQFIEKNSPHKVQQVPHTPWWLAVESAYWYQPEGKGSTIENRMDHPVVHISWNDAHAYSKWAGKRLPTEKEWEYAARGGLNQKKYPWGDELTPNEEHYCNIWQGEFPQHNTKKDGYIGTAPATEFPANGFGLYNVSGNVWEWCADTFQINRNGKVDNEKVDGNIPKVIRGGSYLCHHSYCNRYRVAARSSNTADSSSGNIGFRCVKDV